MLDKTNYTTRTDLSPEEVAALIEIRTQLELGELSFDMGSCLKCIGGHMARMLGKGDPTNYVQEHAYIDKKFNSLFYPRDTNRDLKLLTRGQAVQAITNFLAGQERPWD